MMPKPGRRDKAASCREATTLHATAGAGVDKTCRRNTVVYNMKRKVDEFRRSQELVGRSESSDTELALIPGPHALVSALRDSWEVDSGFSEASPPASGRSSPCLGSRSTAVVALDCEMVGTGPGGHCSELARCSILDYHGNVLYDKYVRPSQRVTDYRTPWSGISKHHLRDAMPFSQAQQEILTILQGKVVVGHSIYNDFDALDVLHPGHMVRDIGASRHLSRLAGFPHKRCPSLKILANKLLNRQIQVGRRGHCSVEDAHAALDLYKLVEGEWERELQDELQDDDASKHYMQDEYWPDHVITDIQ